MRCTHLITLAITIVAAACAHEDPRFVGFYSHYKDCRAKYAEIDARVDAAGVRDAGYYRVPGYPYLRTDRVLASFRNELHTSDEYAGWIRHMREYDQEAREFEYINLGLTVKEAAILRFDLQNCGRVLSSIELDDPRELKRMIAATQPPDDYSDTARTLGLYPLAKPFLRAHTAREQAAVLHAFAQPLSPPPTQAPLLMWQVKAEEDPALVANGYGISPYDELGFPGLFDSAWRALAEINAPALWIATASTRDQPGAPKWSASGPGVDASQPVVYYQIGFTRFGDQRLAQIIYFIWFGGREGAEPGAVDGAIDGLIWRVTLDRDTHPIVFESLHDSGRDHLWFPTRAVTRRQDDNAAAEPALIPQAQVPEGSQALRLQSGTHLLQRVVSTEQATAAEHRTYELRRYEDLFTLPRPDGSSRSLFGPDGLVAGSQSSGELVLRASGVRKPGALRQLGHHATAYVGRTEFDDPFVLESVFVPPADQPPAPG